MDMKDLWKISITLILLSWQKADSFQITCGTNVIFVEGDNGTIRCDYDTDKVLTEYIWNKDGNEIAILANGKRGEFDDLQKYFLDENGTLVINHVNHKDVGVYGLLAISTVGRETGEGLVNVSVSDRPTEEVLPVVTQPTNTEEEQLPVVIIIIIIIAATVTFFAVIIALLVVCLWFKRKEPTQSKLEVDEDDVESRPLDEVNIQCKSEHKDFLDNTVKLLRENEEPTTWFQVFVEISTSFCDCLQDQKIPERTFIRKLITLKKNTKIKQETWEQLFKNLYELELLDADTIDRELFREVEKKDLDRDDFDNILDSLGINSKKTRAKKKKVPTATLR